MGDSEGHPQPERSPDLPGPDENGAEVSSTSAAPPAAEPSAPEAPSPLPPGHLAEPAERPWDSEPVDPFEGIDRSNPFEGRPQRAMPGEAPDLAPASNDAAPGQPFESSPRTDEEGPGEAE